MNVSIFYRNLKKISRLSCSVFSFKHLFQLLALYWIMAFTQLQYIELTSLLLNKINYVIVKMVTPCFLQQNGSTVVGDLKDLTENHITLDFSTLACTLLIAIHLDRKFKSLHCLLNLQIKFGWQSLCHTRTPASFATSFDTIYLLARSFWSKATNW